MFFALRIRKHRRTATTLVDARSWSSISYRRARITLNMLIEGRSQMPRVNLGLLNAKLVCIKL
jgi:hypothetical protein